MADGALFLNSRPNLEVGDLDRAIAFYAEVLGLPLRFRADEFSLAVVGDEGGCEIALQRLDMPHAASCYFNVLGVDAIHARCEAAGATITSPLQTQPWGMRDFVVTDPDGNRIAIGERVAGEA